MNADCKYLIMCVWMSPVLFVNEPHTNTISCTHAKPLTSVTSEIPEGASYFSITGNIFCGKVFCTKPMETPYPRQANKRPLFLKDMYSMSAARGTECAQMFLGQHYLAVEPQAAELLEQFYETFRTGLSAQSSPSKKSSLDMHHSFFQAFLHL